MPTTLQIDPIIRKVEQLLANAASDGVHLKVSGYKLDDNWLYIVVMPGQTGVRASDHAALMSKIERQLRAEGDEHGGEAGDEEERGDENVPPRLGLALVDQRLDAGPGQIAKIRRRQRQHAGADERDEPGAEGGRDGDVGHGRYRWPFGHTASNVAPSPRADRMCVA